MLLLLLKKKTQKTIVLIIVEISHLYFEMCILAMKKLK